MNKKLIALSTLTILLAMPMLVLALAPPFVPPNSPNPNQNLNINNILGGVFGLFWPVATAFVIIMFTLAGFKFFTAQGNPQQIKEARDAVIWGVVGAAVILLAWSVVAILQTQFGL